MKQLILIIALFALPFTVQAQSNLVQSIRLTFLDEGGVVQNTSINLDADEAQGFVLNYIKDLQTAQQFTNPVPTFQNSIRGTTRTFLLKPLADQAKADEWKTNKLDLLFLYGPALRNANVFTAQQKNDLKAIATAPNVATNLPPTQ